MRRALAGARLLRLAVALLGAAAGSLWPQQRPSTFSGERAEATSRLKQGQVNAAIPFLERARRLDPSSYANNWDLALAYRQTRRWQLARQLLRSLIAQQDKGELRNLLAETEEAAGNTEEAARQYQEAAHRDPTEKHIADWANHLMKYRAYDSALKVYQSAAPMHPRSVAIRTGLGAAHYATGNYDDAAREFCAAADLDPADLRPLEFLGKALGIAPEREAAVRERLAGYAARFPDNARARLYHGLSLGEDPSAQERELRKALALDSKLPEAHLQLAALAEQQGRAGEAVVELLRALALQPSLATAHYRLSRLYRKQGKQAEAERHLAQYRRFSAAAGTAPGAGRAPAGAVGLRVE